MNYDIKNNSFTNGIYCVFEHLNEYYYASEIYLELNKESEVMIFPMTPDGKEVLSYAELYFKRFAGTIREDYLIKSIEDFKSQNPAQR